jgi:hypothetical protein
MDDEIADALSRLLLASGGLMKGTMVFYFILSDLSDLIIKLKSI